MLKTGRLTGTYEAKFDRPMGLALDIRRGQARKSAR